MSTASGVSEPALSVTLSVTLMDSWTPIAPVSAWIFTRATLPWTFRHVTGPPMKMNPGSGPTNVTLPVGFSPPGPLRALIWTVNGLRGPTSPVIVPVTESSFAFAPAPAGKTRAAAHPAPQHDATPGIRLSQPRISGTPRPVRNVRPALLRSLLYEPPRDDEVATRTEALAILTALARDGRVAAAIALERALRNEGARSDDELARILEGAA